MRKLKYFESFETLTFDIDDLYWTKATISLSILRGNDVTDLNKIKKMIEDYKITYIKNDEWGGGPTKTEKSRNFQKFQTSFLWLLAHNPLVPKTANHQSDHKN